MNPFETMTGLQAASLYTGLLLLLLLALKMYVGGRRRALNVAPGDVSNPDFARAQRVQQNAVEDVPAMLVGLALIALLPAPLWLVHAAGAVLLLSRIGHAVGLAGSGGASAGRLLGTLGTLLVYLALIIALLLCAFDASVQST